MNGKKIATCLLAWVLLLTPVAAILTAEADSIVAEAAVASPESDFVVDSKGVLTIYMGSGGDVVIPETVGDVRVTSIGDRAFQSCTNLFSITIPSGVTQIGEYVFSDCKALMNVTIPASVEDFGSGTAFIGHSDRMTIYGESGSAAEEFARKCGILFAPIGSKMISVGWNQDGDHWWYCHKDGSYTKSDWEDIDGRRYHFDSHGWRETGWHKLDYRTLSGTSYYYFYFDENGAMVTDAIVGDYYVDGTGKRVKDVWRVINGKSYYFGSDGRKLVGWHKLDNISHSSKDYYYFDENGAMVTNALVGDYYVNSIGLRVKDSWEEIDGKSYYFGSDGRKLVGRHALDNGFHSGISYYYFDENGALLKNAWFGDYYVNEYGFGLSNEWKEIDGKRYYFDYSGKKVVGWKSIKTESDDYYADYYYADYYFDENGVLVTNAWVGDCYVDEEGVRADGWEEIDGKRYFFDSDGYFVGWHQFFATSANENVWHYFDENGVMAMNTWKQIDGKWYYFDESGWMVTGWRQIGGTWYYMYPSGEMASDTVIDGYYLDASGAWVQDANQGQTGGSSASEGWVQSGGLWWYQNADGSYPANEWKQIGGTWYYFDASGWMTTDWQFVGGAWYYMDASGAMQTGWLQLDDTWYYLYSNGEMASDTVVDGYYLDASGVWVQDASQGQNGGSSASEGWLQSGDLWWYQNADGSYPANTWKQIGGTWYYFDASGWMVTGWQQVNGIWYFLDDSGAMQTGWQQVNGIWYFLDDSGAMQTGWQEIGGTWYFLYENGSMAVDTYVGDYYVNASGAWVQ